MLLDDIIASIEEQAPEVFSLELYELKVMRDQLQRLLLSDVRSIEEAKGYVRPFLAPNPEDYYRPLGSSEK